MNFGGIHAPYKNGKKEVLNIFSYVFYLNLTEFINLRSVLLRKTRCIDISFFLKNENIKN